MKQDLKPKSRAIFCINDMVRDAYVDHIHSQIVHRGIATLFYPMMAGIYSFTNLYKCPTFKPLNDNNALEITPKHLF